MSKEINLFSPDEEDAIDAELETEEVEVFQPTTPIEPSIATPNAEAEDVKIDTPEKAPEDKVETPSLTTEQEPQAEANDELPTTSLPLPKNPTEIGDSSLVHMLDKIKSKQELEIDRESSKRKIKQVIEAILFSTKDPVSFNKLREIADVIYPLKPRELKEIIENLQHEYISQDRAFRLIEIGNGYILRTNEEFSHYVNLLYRDKRVEKLSPAATETLAIIAYKQPITRPQIEAIRGVDTTGTIINLLERGLIEAVGRLEAPGRPTLFATTTEFLKYFGLKEASDLPQLIQGA